MTAVFSKRIFFFFILYQPRLNFLSPTKLFSALWPESQDPNLHPRCHLLPKKNVWYQFSAQFKQPTQQ